jgi:hypothetical protein
MSEQIDFLENILNRSYQDTKNCIASKINKKQDLEDILNSNNLEIIDEISSPIVKKKSSNIIEWDKIKTSYSGMKKPIDEWGNKQLYIHLKYLYRNKYPQSELTITDASGYVFIGKLREEFRLESNMEPGPAIIKDYIDWVMSCEIDLIISQKGKFSIQVIRGKRLIRKFIKQREFNEIVIEDKKAESETDTPAQMELLFKISRIKFLMQYGVVTGLNWLIENKNMSENEAIDVINLTLANIRKEDFSIIESIKEKTIRGHYKTNQNRKCLVSVLRNLNIDYSSLVFNKGDLN